jgi:predicted amidohydrolase
MRPNLSRRKFFGNISMGAGAMGLPTGFLQAKKDKAAEIAPKQVNVATVSIMDMLAKDSNEMVQKVLAVMEEIIPYQPDIICLPEIFAYANIENRNYQLRDVAETVPGPIVTPFLAFAAKHKCYVICPTYSLHGNDIYIAAVLIDREGKVAGEYRKMRPAIDEMKMGIKPGKFDPPVFETDFGKIGIQICFDIKYEEGWNSLKDKGAQIIFWPSAFAAGQEISSRAWRHQVYVVTSTQKDTSKICDITGEPIAQTGRWQRNWTFAPVNLEKAFILTWPAVSFFPDIQKKYASRLKLTTYSEEEWTIIESLDANLKVADVLKEYNLKTMHEVLKEISATHDTRREKST